MKLFGGFGLFFDFGDFNFFKRMKYKMQNIDFYLLQKHVTLNFIWSFSL